MVEGQDFCIHFVPHMGMILELFHPLIRQILEKKKSYCKHMKSELCDLFQSISLVCSVSILKYHSDVNIKVKTCKPTSCQLRTWQQTSLCALIPKQVVVIMT